MKVLNCLLICLTVIALGCDDASIDVVETVFLEADTTGLQTELPPYVWQAMGKQAEADVQWIEGILSADPNDQQWLIELQEKLRRNGAADIDVDFFVNLQKDYYNRYIDAGGIAIVGNEEVHDDTFIEARTVTLLMTAKHPKLRDRILAKHGKFYMIIYKVRFDGNRVPELYIMEHLRENIVGTLGACHKGAGVLAETIVGYCFAPEFAYPINQNLFPSRVAYSTVYAHEFAHALEAEIRHYDPTFEDRLEQAYEQAKALGTWNPEGKIMQGYSEYWAVGVEIWFYHIGAERRFETYEDFYEQDPLLAELLDEWFIKGSMPWRPQR